MKFIRQQFETVYNKVLNDTKLSFEEFLIFLMGYGEIEFVHKYKKYMMFRLNDDYSSGKDKIRDESKCYYAFGEYAYEQPTLEQRYKTIEEFALKANIKGRLLKNIWNEISDVNPLD